MTEWDAQYTDPARYRTWPSEELIRWLAARPPQSPTPRSLDLGCGAGGNLWALLLMGHEAYGIDPSPAARQAARQTLRQRGGNIAMAPVYHGDVQAIPFPDEFFEYVVDSMTLQHLVEPEARAKAMRECARVLVPKGRLLTVHLAEGTDYHVLFPGVPESAMPNVHAYLDAWLLSGMEVERVCGIARWDGYDNERQENGHGNRLLTHVAYAVLHLVKPQP